MKIVTYQISSGQPYLIRSSSTVKHKRTKRSKEKQSNEDMSGFVSWEGENT
jgi:hypothetical protein